MQYFECPAGTDMKYNMPYNYFCRDYDWTCPAGTDVKIDTSTTKTCVDNTWTCPSGTDVINTSSATCEANPSYPKFFSSYPSLP